MSTSRWRGVSWCSRPPSRSASSPASGLLLGVVLRGRRVGQLGHRLGAVAADGPERVGDLVRRDAVDERAEGQALDRVAGQRVDHGQADLLGHVVGGADHRLLAAEPAAAVAQHQRMDLREQLLAGPPVARPRPRPPDPPARTAGRAGTPRRRAGGCRRTSGGGPRRGVDRPPTRSTASALIERRPRSVACRRAGQRARTSQGSPPLKPHPRHRQVTPPVTYQEFPHRCPDARLPDGELCPVRSLVRPVVVVPHDRLASCPRQFGCQPNRSQEQIRPESLLFDTVCPPDTARPKDCGPSCPTAA